MNFSNHFLFDRCILYMKQSLTCLKMTSECICPGHAADYNTGFAKSTIVKLMLEHMQIFLLHTQLGLILSYIIHAEVAWNPTPFQKIESNLGVAHEQEIKRRQEAGKLALMGGWVRWIRNRVYSTYGKRLIQKRGAGNELQVLLLYKSNTKWIHIYIWNNLHYHHLITFKVLAPLLRSHKPQNITILCVIWAKPHITGKGDRWYAHCSSKSPLFQSHSVPCGCLATPLQHNILWINRVKRDRCLLKTTSQGCSPIINAFSRRCSNKSLWFITTWLQNTNNKK